MIDKKPKRVPSVTARKINERIILVDRMRRDSYELNETGLGIWQLCDGKNTATTIMNSIKNEFEVTEEEISKDCADFLEMLLKYGLITLE